MEQLTSDSTPLPRLLSILKTRQYVFVLSEREVTGIVTRADLNKPPVRVYLFGLVSLLEMHLGFWVKAIYREDGWQSQLTATRFEAAKKIQSEGQKRKQEMALVDCLQFCDRRDLVLANSEVRDHIGLGTKKNAERLLKDAERLRDLLAHSQHDLANGSSWEERITLVEDLERVVHSSDDYVEETARSAAQLGQDVLWSSA